jgi:hypothetical protein
MTDISNPKLLYAKAGLFVLGGVMAAGVILLDSPSLRTATLLALSIWCFARAYYFAFYVIEHYVDGEFRYAGLGDFFVWSWRRFRKGNQTSQSIVDVDSESAD